MRRGGKDQSEKQPSQTIPIKWMKVHLSPFVHAEDPVRVVSVLADAVQLDGVAPPFGQVLLCAGEDTPVSDLAT